MANDKKTGIENLEEEIVQEIISASDEEILEDALHAGDDPEAYADRMREWLNGAKVEAGKKRLKEARDLLERDRQEASRRVVDIQRTPTPERAKQFIPDTMAARHEKDDLSERDKRALEEDFDELSDDEAWDKGNSDEDS